MGTIRKRKNGSFELRIVHRALDRPYYTTHDTEQDARRYADDLVARLDRGAVPKELLKVPEGKRTPIRAVLSDYLEQAKIAPSDRPVVEVLSKTLDVAIEAMTIAWCDGWVLELKRKQRLAPGTIRKKVESLARAVDWWLRRYGEPGASNPLRLLPKGYSSYGDGDGEPVTDEHRDRRLAPGEEARIEAVILGERRPDRQRPLTMPDRESFLLLFRLIVGTGLRLREAYTLTWPNVRFELRTIHIERSKTGRARDVPMTREIHDHLFKVKKAEGLVFPFWDGDVASLKKTSNRLSQRFLHCFKYAGITDLTEHDLRHEATCRWMLMRDSEGRWLFRPEEVRRITGHKSVQQFERYLSLRGSDLAERLW